MRQAAFMPIDASRTGLILLAAGRGERWGEGQKLSADLMGKPLAHHAAATLGSMEFARHLAICAPATPDLRPFGFEMLATDRPEAGQSYSLALGIAALGEADIDAVMIALADMPFVKAGHILALLDEFQGPPIASTVTGQPTPPVCFGRHDFAQLMTLKGDQGARSLLRDARLIPADARCLADIDTPEELIRWATQS
jgi:molybdenum cofactor cytidylyltransferase